MTAPLHVDRWPTTADELWTADLPDDGTRVEFINGRLVVSPAPSLGHQHTLTALYRLLELPDAGPDHWVHLGVGLHIRNRPAEAPIPDLIVTNVRGDFARNHVFPETVVMTVEIESPSSHDLDRVEKRREYARAGIPWYLLVDPTDPAAVTVDLFRLDPAGGGQSVLTAHATGDETFTADEPFALSFVPAQLLT